MINVIACRWGLQFCHYLVQPRLYGVSELEQITGHPLPGLNVFFFSVVQRRFRFHSYPMHTLSLVPFHFCFAQLFFYLRAVFAQRIIDGLGIFTARFKVHFRFAYILEP